MRFRFIFFLLSLFITACTKSGAPDTPLRKKSDTIPLYEALASLEMRMMQLDMLKTKSGNGRNYNVEDIFVVGNTSIQTKGMSSGTDSLFYVVNFNGGDGYAVLAANRNVAADVLCITEKGSLNSNLFALAQEALMNVNTSSSAVSELPLMADPGDSLFIPSLLLSGGGGTVSPNHLVISDPDFPIDGGGGGGAPAFAGPFLMTKWNQDGNPYDNELSYPYAGCTVVALAQIMAYEEYPAVIQMLDGTFGYWSDMKTVHTYPNTDSLGTMAGQSQVAKLMKLLGSSSLCNVIPDSTGSPGLDISVKYAMQYFGYTNVHLHTSINSFSSLHTTVIMQLMCNKPVYASGLEAQSIYGHAWVIDGFAMTYYHINWGWHGASDGYYNQCVFNTDERQFVASIDPGTTASPSSQYTWFFEVITYDRP